MSKKQVTAFKDELNWIGTGLIVAAGFFTGLPLVIPFAWAAYEAAYLLFVPDSQWYEQRLTRKADAEVEARRRQQKRAFLPTLLPADRARFRELEQVREEIDRQPVSSGTWLREIVRKLDFLLERFLLFAGRRGEYLRYLRELAEREGVVPTDPAGRALPPRARERALNEAGLEPLLGWALAVYEHRITQAERDLARQTDPTTRDVLQKNLEVLVRLRDNLGQIGQIARNLERQLDLVYDSFSLINGQLRTSPPEQMVADVDGVITSSQALSDSLAETAPIEQAIQRLRSGP